MQDPYAVLNVDRNAGPDDIKRAYRKLAKNLHPDLHPGDSKVEDRFKEVSAAYDLLSDPVRRGRFDRGEIDATGQERMDPRFYHARGRHGGGRQSDPFQGGFSAGDIFSDLFGADGGRVRMSGQDVQYTVSVDFLEAANGATKRVTLGDGKTLDITIPEGIQDGQTIRLRGQGGRGLGGGRSGDAFVEVKVGTHSRFKRDGKTILLDLPISLEEAVLGGKIKIPTVHGPVSMKIPAGSNSGDTLRLRGKGIREGKSGAPGDQLVKLLVKLPDEIDADLESFVRDWSKAHPYPVRKDDD